MTEEHKKESNYRLMYIILAISFLIGAGIAAYPTISSMLADRNSIRAIGEYQEYMVQLEPEELEAEWKAARIYNQNLAGDPVRDPFVPNSGMALPENYQDVLNVQGDGIIGYLKIPSVDINLLISHGSAEEVLLHYAGHVEQTALPIGGESTHAVITAHTGLPSARLFTDLVKVKEGDYFYIYVLDEKLTYKVDQIEVILPEEIEKLQMIPGKDYVTLLTCTPYGVNSHRLLVRGMRVADEEVSEERVKDNGNIRKWIIVIIVVLFIIIIVMIFTIKKRRRKKKQMRWHLQEWLDSKDL